VKAAAGPARAWTIAVDRWIGSSVDFLAAALIAVEVLVLSCSVFSRYALHHAIPWADELAVLLFLWLSMLGAVAAYRRSDHMRLSTLANRAPPAVRAWLDVTAIVVVAAFCALMIGPAFGYVLLQAADLSPALNIPESINAGALLVGLVLILVTALLRLIDGNVRAVLTAVAVAAGVVIAAAHWRGAFVPLGSVNLAIFFVGVVGACVAGGIPIAFAFGIGTALYLQLATTVPLVTVVSQMSEGITNLVLLAIPLFVLLGALIVAAGIAQRLVAAIASLVGHLRGGLNIVLVSAMYLVSGISGSKTADMAAVAPVLFPEMERRGQSRSEMVALLAASGAMAETIPPSLVLIIIGTIAGVSIRDLFAAGLLPAAVAAIALLAVALLRSREPGEGQRAMAKPATIARALFVASPGLALPFLIRFFVVTGIATATEVSTIGIAYTLFTGVVIYREFRWRSLYAMLCDTASLTGAIMLIIATATAMAWALTQSGFAHQLAAILAQSGNAVSFMLVSLVLFVVLGAVLEGIPAMVLFGPLLFPIAQHVGINLVHYAIVAVLAMGIGLFAPPLGIGYYAACAIGRCDPDTAARTIWPYLGALGVALLIVALVPWLSTAFITQ
jgi:tripartite ATP-independent transporter DctM subunit